MHIVYVSYRLKLYNNCIGNNVNILHPISKCFISLAISFGKQRWPCCLNIFPRCEYIPIAVQRLCYANILVPKRNGRCYEFNGTAPRNIGVTEKQNANCFGRCLKSFKDKRWSCKNALICLLSSIAVDHDILRTSPTPHSVITKELFVFTKHAPITL